jgi:hypothetical protein
MRDWTTRRVGGRPARLRRETSAHEVAMPAQDGELVAQHKDLDVLVG